jgi:hypothetical protein
LAGDYESTQTPYIKHITIDKPFFLVFSDILQTFIYFYPQNPTKIQQNPTKFIGVFKV